MNEQTIKIEGVSMLRLLIMPAFKGDAELLWTQILKQD